MNDLMLLVDLKTLYIKYQTYRRLRTMTMTRMAQCYSANVKNAIEANKQPRLTRRETKVRWFTNNT